MKFKDYDWIMGVAPEADVATLKTVYRMLVLKWHPDVSKPVGTERRFTDLVACGMVVSKEAGFAETDLHGLQIAERLHRDLVLELSENSERLRVTVPFQFWMNP